MGDIITNRNSNFNRYLSLNQGNLHWNFMQKAQCPARLPGTSPCGRPRKRETCHPERSGFAAKSKDLPAELIGNAQILRLAPLTQDGKYG